MCSTPAGLDDDDDDDDDDASEWVNSFLTAPRHILGYLVPYHGVVDLHEEGGYFKAT